MEFERNLKALRKLHGYTQQELAEKLHFGSTAICNYELGNNQPSFGVLVRLAEILGVSVDALLGVEDNVLEFRKWKLKYDGLSIMQKKEVDLFMDFIQMRDK